MAQISSLRSGLIRGSFIPPKEVRELRDLTRYKRKLIQTITSEKQRVEKILEDANIKLSSIASDTFGGSGKRIIEELMRGELKPEAMAELTKGRLRNRKAEMKEALVGNMEDHHRFMIQAHLTHIAMMEGLFATVEQKIPKMKGTSLWSKYHSLVGRRGKKKALVAIGHKILVMCYHILKHKVPYKELGPRHRDERRKDRIAKSYIRRLSSLGYAVTVKEAA